MTVEEFARAWQEAIERHLAESDRRCRAAVVDHADDLEWQRAISRWNRKHLSYSRRIFSLQTI